MSDVVVLSVVLEEVKNKNLSIYNRLRTVIDNPLRHFFVFSNENHKYDIFCRCCLFVCASCIILMLRFRCTGLNYYLSWITILAFNFTY